MNSSSEVSPPTPRTGLARYHQLWTLFRNEQSDPVPFYTLMARDVVDNLEAAYGPVRGKQIADLGCGPGWYTRELRGRGAEVVPIDNSEDELLLAGTAPEGALLADAGDLPFPDMSFDGVVCSNLLEHTPHSPLVLREIARVLKPGGWAYISWTNWYSPWGGHDMSPYHFLGPQLGPKLYHRRHGKPRKNDYGEGLWAVHIGPTLRVVHSDPRLIVDRVEPRYWPELRFITRIPGLRELLTWNCVIRVHRTSEATPANPPAGLG